ncbi:carboxymuconolactone decarboxylase family protein, partial [Actinocorallia lasiicapitis]
MPVDPARPSVNTRWPLPRMPRLRPALPLPWFPPTTAAGAVLVRHPRLFSALFPLYLASYPALALKPRERELVILRASWNAGGYYEWGHHANVQRALGRDWAWMRRIALGPDADGWEPRQVARLRAVDELYTDQRIGDDTWRRLYFLSPRQRTELCLVAGFYDAGASLYGSLGVPYDGWSRTPLTLASPPPRTAPLRDTGPLPAPIPA